MPPSTRCLVVTQGLNAGARMVVDDQVKLVGRARDADLVLEDRAVSRHHFQLVATEEGARIRACADTASLVVAGMKVREAIVKVGDSILVGDTVLVLTEEDAREVPRDPGAHAATTIHALLNGPGADVRGFAALFALHEALEVVDDAQSLELTLASWAKLHADCRDVEWADDPFGAVSDGSTMAVLHTLAAGDRAKIVVPVHTPRTRWVAFTTTLPAPHVTDSLRRLLAMAGRLCASRAAQLSALLAVKEDREFLRQQAIGSARAFLGTSAGAADVVRLIPKLALSEANVLLTGETGAGKTFVARLIHESGPRKDEPLRIINCAAIPVDLIESELFGHERGAFTGATTLRRGALEAAEGGTALLDEIGELPLASQAKLLRVLEAKRYERLGSNRPLTLRARVLAATNRDLEAMVAAGTFRNDLLFRVAVVRLTVPPLRDRGEDLVLLAKRILADFIPSAGRRIDGFSPETLDTIRRYPWPGNVRELRNAIEHAVAVGDGRFIEVTDFPAVVRLAPAATDASAKSEQTMLVELPMNEEQLQAKNRDAAVIRSAGNITRAAALLGIERTTLYKKRRGGN